MKKYLSLSLRIIKLSIMSRMSYKQEFLAWALVTTGWVAFTFIFYELLFSNVSSIAGWDKGQMYVLQGFVFLIEFLTWGFFFYSLKYLPDQIVHGEIDKDIVKPINTQYALSFRGFGIQHITSLIVGIATINYGLGLTGATISLQNIFIAFLAYVLVGIMLYALYFMSISVSFWFDKLSNLIYLIPNSLDMARVPIDAYKGIVKISLTYVIPVALASSVPTSIIFNQINWNSIIYLFFFSFGALFLSNYILKQGLKRYSSASS
ncbi:ABC transporter permease [Patescibacteria group bacterium]